MPELVIAQCKAGVVGSFPALNAREKEGDPIELEKWLKKITEELDRHNQKNPDDPAAPFAVNQIVHRSNSRLMRDIEICVKWKVPIWITSLGARPEVNEAAHSCGGIVLHDIINNTFANKAIDRGADGLIAVAAGAGGHAGPQSPFALIQEIREAMLVLVIEKGVTDSPGPAAGSVAANLALCAGARPGGMHNKDDSDINQKVVLRKDMINLPRLMGIGIVLALLATQAQTAALAHSVRESQTELMKKRMQTLFPTLSS